MIPGIQYIKDSVGFLPFLILLASGLIVLLGSAITSQGESGRYGSGVSIVGTIIAIMSLGVLKTFKSNTLFNGMLIIDDFTLFLTATILIGTLVVILISRNAVAKEGAEINEYYMLLLFSSAGMILMVQSINLILVFLALEIFSLAIYILVGITKQKKVSIEASLKYLLLGAFAAAFFLYGMTYIYGATGTLDLIQIANKVSEGSVTSNTYLVLGASLILFGLGFKIALVPFHMWTPDVYEGAPTPITAYMAVGVKAAAFAVFIRVFGHALPKFNVEWNTLLWLLAVLTMTVGNICALLQDSLKRMLAYSSIAHAGYIFVAIVAGSKYGYGAILYYLLVYTFMNLGAFGVVVYVENLLGQKDHIDSFKGFGFRKPIIGLCMAIFLCSLMGLPPTGGFMAKFAVFSSAVREGYIWLVIIGVLNSAVAAYYYLRVIVVMYTRPETMEKLGSPAGSIYNAIGLIISLTGTLILGIVPYRVLEMAIKAVSL
ncbi:NADH-quinone oxidoreductase subunit N [Desulfothermus okinawensis JCM 13304]